MLQLKNIVKDYVSGDNVTHALKGLNINFRRNEFVAILGPSGCGKTTLLNITGGLDRYTTGDLIIEGKSTKNYKDGDWDTYRNHSVGFVFQSYNLIYHQSVLKNVELALTISGISKAERKARAEKALEMVGLGGLGKKKPNQMSGGQMQRVAIARALVNNPEIVMADEPTGALDSETSVQIMDILKEVAKDRLVIMVTHNPDLANIYATRIIAMKDGVVTSDSNPYVGESKEERKAAHSKREEVSKGKKKKTSMSFFTAMGLSFSNLISKLKRTILVTIAGSIGIVGVSAVLAVSQGVTDYINSIQDDMLSSYPVQIAEESVDLTSLLSGLSASETKDAFKFDPNDPRVGVDSMVDYLMTAYSNITNVKTNTINDELIDWIEQTPKEAVYSIYKNYAIDPTNNIFTSWVSNPNDKEHKETISLNGLTQRYIAELQTVKGFSNYASYVNLFTDFMKEFPADKDYILSQYDLLSNSTLDDPNGIVLVVDQNTTLTDLILAQMGFFDHDEFLNIAKRAIKINDLPKDMTNAEREKEIKRLTEKYPYRKDFAYEDLLGKELIYYPQGKIYKKGEVAEAKVTVQLFATGAKIIYFSYDEENDLLKGQVISMMPSFSMESVLFYRDGEKPTSVSNLAEYAKGIWKAYKEDDKTKDVIYELDNTNVLADPPMMNIILTDYKGTTPVPYTLSGSAAPVPENVKGYHYQAELSDSMKNDVAGNGGTKMKISGLLRLKEGKSFGCLQRGVYYSHQFADKFMKDSNDETALLTKDFQNYIGSEEEKSAQYNAYVKFKYWDYTKEDEPEEKDGYATSLNGDLNSSFSDLFSAITGVNYVESDKVHLRSVCGMKANGIDDNGDGNVDRYTFEELPRDISIYPKSFDEKDIVTNHLDRWNSDDTLTVFNGTKTLTKKDRPELTYTDTIKLIISVINTLITTVTIALVSFTSLALVVSCFMIAVITYISVVERTKEIGIIRSVGGRKKDVSRLFITETFMTGFFSGVFGLLITYIFEIVFNIVMKSLFGIGGLANLTVWTALIMLGISILLSVLSGLIPSMKASHQDPVVALRSNE